MPASVPHVGRGGHGPAEKARPIGCHVPIHPAAGAAPSRSARTRSISSGVHSFSRSISPRISEYGERDTCVRRSRAANGHPAAGVPSRSARSTSISSGVHSFSRSISQRIST